MADRFLSIREGDEAEFLHVITEGELEAFVRLTGDNNPLHVDSDFAKRTSFRSRVVHGMLTASFVSTIIGVKLVGSGALWYEQFFQFLAPARVGERIRVWGRVKQKSESQRIVVVEIAVFGDGDRKLVSGEGKVKVLEVEEQSVQEKAMAEERGAVIVTGGGRGIGAAVSQELARLGFAVVVNYLNSGAAAEEVARAIAASGGRAAAFQADVRDPHAVVKLVSFAKERFGTVFGVVNNASGPIENKAFAELGWTEMQSQLDIHLKGAFQVCQEVLAALSARKEGAIVNIATIFADNVPPARMAAYCAGKAALVSLTKSLAVEYGPMGIRVNCVSPGMTETELIANVPEKAKLLAKMQAPLRRLAAPKDVAGAVGFLFSDGARHITGETLRVCGGSVMV